METKFDTLSENRAQKMINLLATGGASKRKIEFADSDKRTTTRLRHA
jgi:hypothetical protein